jgi:hypothetical protein
VDRARKASANAAPFVIVFLGVFVGASASRLVAITSHTLCWHGARRTREACERLPPTMRRLDLPPGLGQDLIMADDVVPSWIPRDDAGQRGINVRHRQVAGSGFHLTGHAHSSEQIDYIKDGAAALGPVAYSLLRAESFSLYEHRGKRMGSTVFWLEKLTARAEKVSRLDEGGAHKLFRQNAPLYVWDLIGFVSETCEHLACVFDSLRRYRARKVTDLGVAMLGFEKPAFEVFASSAFEDLAWWRAELGTFPDEDRFALLTSRQQELMIESCKALDARMVLALSTVRFIYTKDLHRVAVRRRHAASLLDPERGLAWVSSDPVEAKSDVRVLEDGALAVADTDGRGGPVVELLLPLSWALINDLFGCVKQARWLVHALSWAALGRVENPSHLPFVFDDEVAVPDRLVAEWDGLMCAYTGLDPAGIAAQRKEWRRIDETIEAAERPTPSANRAQRRHPSRQSRKRTRSS